MSIDSRYPWMKAVSECPANVEAIARRIASHTQTSAAYNPRTGHLLFYHSNMAFCYPGLLVNVPGHGWALPSSSEVGRYVSLINRARSMDAEEMDRVTERIEREGEAAKAELVGREDEERIRLAEDVMGHAERKARGVEKVVSA